MRSKKMSNSGRVSGYKEAESQQQLTFINDPVLSIHAPSLCGGSKCHEGKVRDPMKNPEIGLKFNPHTVPYTVKKRSNNLIGWVIGSGGKYKCWTDGTHKKSVKNMFHSVKVIEGAIMIRVKDKAGKHTLGTYQISNAEGCPEKLDLIEACQLVVMDSINPEMIRFYDGDVDLWWCDTISTAKGFKRLDYCNILDQEKRWLTESPDYTDAQPENSNPSGYRDCSDRFPPHQLCKKEGVDFMAKYYCENDQLDRPSVFLVALSYEGIPIHSFRIQHNYNKIPGYGDKILKKSCRLINVKPFAFRWYEKSTGTKKKEEGNTVKKSKDSAEIDKTEKNHNNPFEQDKHFDETDKITDKKDLSSEEKVKILDNQDKISDKKNQTPSNNNKNLDETQSKTKILIKQTASFIKKVREGWEKKKEMKKKEKMRKLKEKFDIDIQYFFENKWLCMKFNKNVDKIQPIPTKINKDGNEQCQRFNEIEKNKHIDDVERGPWYKSITFLR